MGANCATLDRPEDAAGSHVGSKAGSKASAAPLPAEMSKDTRFWHEKMRFSHSSQSLFIFAVQGDAEQAAKAVRGLGDPNCCSAHGYRPLQVAISCGNFELLELILKAGADINCRARGAPPPIVLAAGTGDTRVFSLLLAYGADLALADETLGETALTRAAQRGDANIMRVALSHGSPGFQKLLAQKQRSGDGASALHLAAAGGHRAVCDLLLGVGAEPSVADKRGRTSVYCAVEGNHVDTAGLLLTFGAPPSAPDREGQAPLHIAADRGLLAVADALLRFAADVNAQRADGRTPVHLAAQAGHDVLCRLLILQGAGPGVEDNGGLTPFDLAFRESQVKCCRLLLESGAEVRPVGPDLGWAPPYTEMDPHEHESMRTGKMRRPRDDETSRDLVGC